MTYSGYIKDHPAYCLDHRCRKFHVLKYIIWYSRPSNLVWNCHNLTPWTIKSCLPNWSTMVSVTWLCSGLKATFLAASNLSDSIKLALQCKPSWCPSRFDSRPSIVHSTHYRNNLLPPLLLNLFVTNSQIHNYGTRTASNYRTHLCRTNLKQFTILYQVPKIWNSLPVSVTHSSNLLSFKTKMQEFLLK